MGTRLGIPLRRIIRYCDHEAFTSHLYAQRQLSHHHICWAHMRQTSYYAIKNLISNKALKKWRKKIIFSLHSLPWAGFLTKSPWSILLLYQGMINKFIHSFKNSYTTIVLFHIFLWGIRIFIHFYLTNICWVLVI